MKKIKKIVYSIAAILILAASSSISITKAYGENASGGIDPGTNYYQTMRYCGSQIKRACTSKVLAYPCTSYYCLTSY